MNVQPRSMEINYDELRLACCPFGFTDPAIVENVIFYGRSQLGIGSSAVLYEPAS
jgi:hypothetical protein